MFATSAFASGEYKSKDTLIEDILEYSKDTYLNAPKQEGKFEIGFNSKMQTVYRVYPKISDTDRDKLIEKTLVKVEAMLNKFSNKELSLGFDEYKIALKNQARFIWLPKYAEPEYPDLAYYEGSLDICFSSAIQKHESKIAKQKKEKEIEKYNNNRVDGMPSTWAKDDIASAIEKGYVPKALQSNYQDPITREEFSELFVTALFKDFNNSYEKIGSSLKMYWEFEKLTPKIFLSKVSTTQIFKDTNNDYVKIANILGIINSNTDNRFNPSLAVTREDAAVMIANYYHTLGSGRRDISYQIEDLDDVSSWAKKGVIGAYSSNFLKADIPFIEDYSNNQYKLVQRAQFKPQKSFSREDAIIAIYNIQKNHQSYNSYIILRGFIPASMDSLMSGFDIDRDIVKYKKSGYDNKYSSINLIGSYFYKVKTSYLTKYKSEEIDAIFLTPLCVHGYESHSMYNTNNIDKVLSGEKTYYDYKVFTIEHNKDGYLAIATKTSDDYMLGGYYKDNGQYVKIKIINDTISPYKNIYDKSIDKAAKEVAQNLIDKIITDGMTETEKVEAITKALKTHGEYYFATLSSSAMTGYNSYHHAYNALVEKLANYSGWYDAYELMFDLAGLDHNPEYGTYEYEQSFADNKKVLTNKIAVKADGKWILVDFLPKIYSVPKSQKYIKEEAEKKSENNIQRLLDNNKIYVKGYMDAAKTNPQERVVLKKQIQNEKDKFKYFEVKYPTTKAEKDEWRERGYIFVDKNAKVDSDGTVLFKDIYESK
jgi:hypothetical protein